VKPANQSGYICSNIITGRSQIIARIRNNFIELID